MSAFAGILTIFLIVHAAHSYILLSANLEDVQTLAKQLSASPVVDQINRIWRRASNHFNHYISDDKVRRGADGNIDESAEQYRRNYKPDQHRRKEGVDDDLVAMGKNISLYLKSIKKIFEKI